MLRKNKTENTSIRLSSVFQRDKRQCLNPLISITVAFFLRTSLVMVSIRRSRSSWNRRCCSRTESPDMVSVDSSFEKALSRTQNSILINFLSVTRKTILQSRSRARKSIVNVFLVDLKKCLYKNMFSKNSFTTNIKLEGNLIDFSTKIARRSMSSVRLNPTRTSIIGMQHQIETFKSNRFKSQSSISVCFTGLSVYQWNELFQFSLLLDTNFPRWWNKNSIYTIGILRWGTLIAKIS